MNTQNRTALVVIGLAIGIGFGGASVTFAKGHDQGVADGIPSVDDTGLFSRNGAIAGRDVPGVGIGRNGAFLGVAKDLQLDLNYGEIVRVQAAEGTRNTVPTVNNRR